MRQKTDPPTFDEPPIDCYGAEADGYGYFEDYAPAPPAPKAEPPRPMRQKGAKSYQATPSVAPPATDEWTFRIEPREKPKPAPEWQGTKYVGPPAPGWTRYRECIEQGFSREYAAQQAKIARQEEERKQWQKT